MKPSLNLIRPPDFPAFSKADDLLIWSDYWAEEGDDIRALACRAYQESKSDLRLWL